MTDPATEAILRQHIGDNYRELVDGAVAKVLKGATADSCWYGWLEISAQCPGGFSDRTIARESIKCKGGLEGYR